ncbi:MAG: RidA family protein [Rhodospirillales bacterium]
MPEVIIPKGLEAVYERFHYAPAIRIGQELHISGQVGRRPDLSVVEEPEAQFVQAFENVKLVLDAAGADFTQVYELESWFIAMQRDLPLFMAVKDRYFVERYPTWTGFQVADFSTPGLLVEIRCRAHLG